MVIISDILIKHEYFREGLDHRLKANVATSDIRGRTTTYGQEKAPARAIWRGRLSLYPLPAYPENSSENLLGTAEPHHDVCLIGLEVAAIGHAQLIRYIVPGAAAQNTVR